MKKISLAEYMRKASDLNALVAPVVPGDIIQSGDDYFLCTTNMRGKWTVARLDGDCWQIVDEDVDGQIALVGWFERRQGSHSILAS